MRTVTLASLFGTAASNAPVQRALRQPSSDTRTGRGASLVLLCLAPLLEVACLRSGYEVREVRSTVPYHRLDLRKFGHTRAFTFFVKGLQCLDPLTLVYSWSESTGYDDPSQYFALVLQDNKWSSVRIQGDHRIYHSPSPADGNAYNAGAEMPQPKTYGQIENSSLRGLPPGLDLALLGLPPSAVGNVALLRFDQAVPSRSLLQARYLLEFGSKVAFGEVYDLYQRKRLVRVELHGEPIYQRMMSSQHRFDSGELTSGFYLIQPNIWEVILFDLRNHWPKFKQYPRNTEPKCAPLN